MDGFADQKLAVLLPGQVRGEEVALCPSLLYELLGLLGILLLVRQVSDEGVGALQGKQNCSRASNARVTSSDESLLALQLAGSPVVLETTLVVGQLVIDGLDGQIALFAGETLICGLWQPAFICL